MLDSLFEPFSRLGVVLLHALTIFIENAEIAHGEGVASVCRLREPSECFVIILRHT